MSRMFRFGGGLAIVAALVLHTGCEKAADSTGPATVPEAVPVKQRWWKRLGVRAPRPSGT